MLTMTSASLLFVRVVTGGTLLNKMLESRFMVRCGDVRYIFYLLHTVVMFPLKPLFVRVIVPHVGPEAGFVLFGILALGGRLSPRTSAEPFWR